MQQAQSRNNLEYLVKLVAKSGMLIFAGSMIGKALRFLFYIIVIRVLGASLYGLYSLGQSLIDIVTNVALLGDGRGVVRFGAEFLENKDSSRFKGMILLYLYACSLASIFIATLIFIFSGYISVHFFHEEALKNVLKMFAFGFPFYIFALSSIPIGYVLHKVEYKVIVQEIFQPLASIVTVVVMFLLGWRLYGAVGAFIISSIASALLGWYLIKRIFPDIISKTYAIFQIKRLFIYSVPIILILFSYYLILRIDRIILGMNRSAYDVGIYSAVSNTAIMVFAFSGIFEAGFAPIMAQLSSGGRIEELKKIYNLVTIWGASLTFVPVIILMIFNQEFLAIFGSEFKASGYILIILTLAFFIEVIPGQLKQLFQLSSKQNMELFNSLLMVIANILFNFLLIPRFGMMGASLAVFSTFVLISIIRLIEVKWFYKFVPFSSRYIRLLVFIFCSIVISINYITKLGFPLRILSAGLITAGFVILFYKLKSGEDMLIWNAIKRKFYTV